MMEGKLVDLISFLQSVGGQMYATVTCRCQRIAPVLFLAFYVKQGLLLCTDVCQAS